MVNSKTIAMTLHFIKMPSQYAFMLRNLNKPTQIWNFCATVNDRNPNVRISKNTKIWTEVSSNFGTKLGHVWKQSRLVRILDLFNSLQSELYLVRRILNQFEIRPFTVHRSMKWHSRFKSDITMIPFQRPNRQRLHRWKMLEPAYQLLRRSTVGVERTSLNLSNFPRDSFCGSCSSSCPLASSPSTPR